MDATEGYKWLSQRIANKSDLLGNELGPLKVAACIASQLCEYAIRKFNRAKFPGGPEKGSDETDRERNDPKEVVEL